MCMRAIERDKAAAQAYQNNHAHCAEVILDDCSAVLERLVTGHGKGISALQKNLPDKGMYGPIHNCTISKLRISFNSHTYVPVRYTIYFVSVFLFRVILSRIRSDPLGTMRKIKNILNFSPFAKLVKNVELGKRINCFTWF